MKVKVEVNLKAKRVKLTGLMEKERKEAKKKDQKIYLTQTQKKMTRHLMIVVFMIAWMTGKSLLIMLGSISWYIFLNKSYLLTVAKNLTVKKGPT